MKAFTCSHCQELIFFENSQCINCGSTLAYLTDKQIMAALEPTDNGLWLYKTSGATYKLCQNYQQYNVCNWAMPAEDAHDLCLSCQLTEVIPNLSLPENKEAWYKLEVAKRRLVYSLIQLGCPVESKEFYSEGLSFKFLSDEEQDEAVLTGHADGVITINLAEADDAEREKRKQDLGEPYRTLLGHFRHESGHYYWDRLFKNTPVLESYRLLFGDERLDYGQSLQTYYQQGAAPNWQESFISAYASAHPWEDWAETWAHYLHMIDTLETAETSGLRFGTPENSGRVSFEELAGYWFKLTYLLNNLNRSLGLADAYPFVLSNQVLAKLEFIDRLLAR